MPDRSHVAPPAVRRRRRGGAGAAAFVLTFVFAVPAALVSLPSVAAAYPSSTVVISGHGFGHGIGMGQWGSLGYAIGADNGDGNFTYQQILDNYYGGTTLTPTDDATSMHDGNVIVAMTEANDAYTIAAAADPGVDVTYTGGSAPAVMFQPSGTSGVFSIWTAAGCAGPTWTEVGTTSTPTTSAADGGPVDLCTTSDTLELHGTLTALLNFVGRRAHGQHGAH